MDIFQKGTKKQIYKVCNIATSLKNGTLKPHVNTLDPTPPDPHDPPHHHNPRAEFCVHFL